MNPQITSALIAAGVSAAGVAVTLVSARWQLRGKMSELELKRDEVEKIGAKLQAEAEALRQTLMRDVLARRMQAYAALWRVFISYERNWLIEEKALNEEWATSFLIALNACNAEHGVFFSQNVYHPFFEYRKRLVDIVKSAKMGQSISEDDVSGLVEVSTIGIGDMKSLGGAMKDDLGSYMRVVIQTG
jgi:uncharacterized FlgJ-related protein